MHSFPQVISGNLTVLSIQTYSGDLCFTLETEYNIRKVAKKKCRLQGDRAEKKAKALFHCRQGKTVFGAIRRKLRSCATKEQKRCFL